MNWQSADSFDGRYFGPISSSAVLARAQPVWIEKE
jgi:type IV secretory pathway protease TraF